MSVTADMENHYNSTSNHFSSTSSQAAVASGGASNNHSSTPGGTGSGNCDDRIVFLEKELSHWRAQYELLKIETTSQRGAAEENVHDSTQDKTEK